MEHLLHELRCARTDLKSAKHRLEMAEEAVVSAYKEQIDSDLNKRETPTGTVDLGQVKVKYPKKVKWDQEVLGSLYKEIGDTAAEYIRTEYKVSETAYKNWGDNIKKFFEPARTVVAGKPTIEVTETE